MEITMTTTLTSTDRHRPSAPQFDPQAYDLEGVFDLNPSDLNVREHARRLAAVNRLIEDGYRFASHQCSGNCGHCGAWIRYAALLSHPDSHELIWVGETCLDNRFSRTKAEFDSLRKQAALDAAQHRTLARYRELCDTHPALAYASYAADIADAYVSEVPDPRHSVTARAGLTWALSVLIDIHRKARLYGDISAKQAAFLDRLWSEIDGKLVALATVVPEPPAGPVPTGKGVVVEGVIVAFKDVDGTFGPVIKATVKLANGARVYTTLPAAISDAEHGDRVRFTAMVTASHDPDFGFASRPRAAQVITRKAVAA